MAIGRVFSAPDHLTPGPGSGAQPTACAPVALTAEIPGQRRIVDYNNMDMPDPANGCGQAAIATIETFWGVGIASENPGLSCAEAVTTKYPPGAITGGTSPQVVLSALRDAGLNPDAWIEGDDALRDALDNGYIALTILALRPLTGEWLWHYALAYGYDENNVYITNWPTTNKVHTGLKQNALTWDQFRAARDHWSVKCVLWHTAGHSLAAAPDTVDKPITGTANRCCRRR